MLFVQPQDNVFRLKLYEIGCMMRNFTPDRWAQNTLNGLVRIGIKFYSQMSVAFVFN